MEISKGKSVTSGEALQQAASKYPSEVSGSLLRAVRRGQTLPSSGGDTKKAPLGYNAYKIIHGLRHPGVVMLSEKGFAVDPWRAMEIALGLKPRPVVSKLRERRDKIIPGYFD